MSLLLTVPDRIKIMAIDASTAIRDGDDYFTENVDETRRPFVLVEVGQEDMPAVAAGAEEPVQEYAITVISEKYGQGGRREAEILLRQIASDLKDYFKVRTQLQFSNTRGLQAAPLPALVGVMWARLYVRSLCGVVQKGTDGENPFWGAIFSLRVQGVESAEEVII